MRLSLDPGLARPTRAVKTAPGMIGSLVVSDIIRSRREYEIVGLLDDIHPERARTGFCGATILGGAEQLDRLRRQEVDYLICGIGDGRARLRLSALARTKGYR